MGHGLAHTVLWDDQQGSDQQLDVGTMMGRLAAVLDAELTEKIVRDEPRYVLRRTFREGFELEVAAGHLYDDRERLSMAFELHRPGDPRPIASYHVSGGIDRIKAAPGTAWIRAHNGTVLIVGGGLGGILEVQN